MSRNVYDHPEHALNAKNIESTCFLFQKYAQRARRLKAIICNGKKFQ